MTYFSSYYPDIETTRLDIESRIRTLQDRLYMRRELTDDIQRQEIQLNINNLYRMLKETIDSQSQIHSELAQLRSEVDRDSRFQNRIATLENTRKEAAERAMLLEQQLKEISSDRRYPLVTYTPPLTNIELAERELLDDRLRREYSDITASSEIRRQQLLRESERLDQLRGAADYSGLRKPFELDATGYTRNRGESEAFYDKKELSRTAETFPLRNQQFQNTKQDRPKKYDTPFKSIDPKLAPQTSDKQRGYIGNYSQIEGEGRSEPRRKRSRSNSDQDQSQRLIQKYARGDKAKEYEQIMGKYRNNGDAHIPVPGSGSKPLRQSQLIQRDRLKRSKKQQNSSSPEISRSRSSKKNYKRGHYTFNNNENLANMSMLERQRDRDNCAAALKRSRSRSASTSRQQRSGIHKSASKKRMKHNTDHMTKVKTSAVQRINLRLQLAWAIYEDSEFRNKKHEHDHLFNTYANQERLRKQIRDKIEFQPQVQRKFGFHVEAT